MLHLLSFPLKKIHDIPCLSFFRRFCNFVFPLHLLLSSFSNLLLWPILALLLCFLFPRNSFLRVFDRIFFAKNWLLSFFHLDLSLHGLEFQLVFLQLRLPTRLFFCLSTIILEGRYYFQRFSHTNPPQFYSSQHSIFLFLHTTDLFVRLNLSFSSELLLLAELWTS